MFKLQRLEITGFKSFADHTEIVFTGNGITAVVGPNGCGKSNVSDAISWVLGEQRAKSLRGGEMKDVVFQGTKNRKPSGMSEVVLHLVRDDDAFDADDAELEDIDETLSSIDELAVDVDAIEAEQAGEELDAVAETAVEAHTNGNGNGFHTDEEVQLERVQAAQVGSVQTVERTIKTKRHWRPRSFALDFAPGEAVSVTRRLYLSGESEYQLNGKTCRLRDIQDLFAGTGLSGAHYAIVEQGRIGQILSAKPGDRRNLIEEAAGISKFRTRQRAAESRLESAKTNLGRISDIVSEIEKQANSLRRQAAKTRRYVALQEEFRILLRQLFAAEGRYLTKLLAELEGNLAAAVKLESDLAERVTAQEDAFRTATRAARESEEALADVRRRHAESALERDRDERDLRYRSEQVVSLRERTTALKGEIEAAKERLRLAGSEQERLEVEEQKESADADATRLILVEAEKAYSAKVDDVKAIEGEMDSRRAELLTHTAAVERFDELAKQLEFNIERLRQRAAGLEREAKRADETHDEHVAEAQRAASELTAEREKLEGLAKEKAQITATATAAREALEGADLAARSAESELEKNRNRLETLRELEEKRAVYTPQIQKIFAGRENIGVRPLGVLADFLNVDERAEKAIESLFGPHLQAVVVKDLAEARKLSDWLAANKIGRVSVLAAGDPGTSPSGVERNGLPVTVADALGISDELRKSLTAAFPREMSARLVEKITESSTAGADMSVSLAGEVLFGGCLLITGSPDSDTKNESLLAFKRELTGLGRTVSRLERDAAAARDKANSARAELAEVEEKAVDLQSLIIKVERHLLSLEMNEQTVQQEIERSERHRKVIMDETEQVTGEIAELRTKIDEARASRESAVASRMGVERALEEVRGRLTAARERADADNALLNEKRTAAATTSERRRSAEAALRRVRSEHAELETRIESLGKELTDTESRIDELTASVENIKGRISSVDTAVEAERAELESFVTGVAAAREAADAASNELGELNRRAGEARNERAAIEVRQAEAMTRLENAGENCQQELNVSINELAEEPVPEDFDLAAAHEEVDAGRRRLEGFGAINMLAVDELAEAEERLLFLTSQRQDIVESIASAEEALREIKERSRERFRHAFEAINENFKEFFSELFGGGRGEMTLLESDDILEAGIEVVAQPPGKRLQNILLLSGGEKAMTAIALVLAIFRYRPSPFCLLDEVDAPLDDANVGRFVNKIAEMSEKTQFIVITHNKRTMEAARALYGVTMQEAGVSKVVSVKFE